MSKEEFIGNYLNRNMKNHKLPYSIEYLNLLADKEEKAEKKWNKLQTKNKLNDSKTC